MLHHVISRHTVRHSDTSRDNTWQMNRMVPVGRGSCGRAAVGGVKVSDRLIGCDVCLPGEYGSISVGTRQWVIHTVL